MNSQEAYQERDDSYRPPRLRCKKCGRFRSARDIDLMQEWHPRYHSVYDEHGNVTGIVIDGEDTADVFVLHCPCGYLGAAS